jgi:hypothetical protein
VWREVEELQHEVDTVVDGMSTPPCCLMEMDSSEEGILESSLAEAILALIGS